MTIESWLAAASSDADRRGLPGLKPLLETLARSTSALRAAHAAIAEANVSAPPGNAAPGDGRRANG
jgi:hypothetical protein